MTHAPYLAGISLTPYILQGVANGFTDVTNLPSSLAIASAWDPELAFQFGQANGREHVIKGADVVLCPAINIARIPWCGRLFQYLGEDPTLASYSLKGRGNRPKPIRF